MRFFLPVRPLLKGWLFSLLAWGLIAFALSWQLTRVVSLPQWQVLRIAAREWLPWALLTPLLFRFASRLPIERERWKVAVPAHLVLCIATMFFCRWWGAVLVPPSFHGAHGPGHGTFHGGEAPGEGAQFHEHHHGFAQFHSPPPWFAFNFFGPGSLQLPIYLALVSAAHALHFYRRSIERDRRSLELAASLARARLDALKMQLQPHFLFNALNAISALMHRDVETADQMLGALSDFLRLTLESSGQQEAPLRRELEFAERYLAIEKARFGDRLTFSIDAPAETLNALVPSLILQPLVENAIRHGLEPQLRPGTLKIRAWRKEEELFLEVSDNGGGLAEKSPAAREGIGLANTRARLREAYGNKGTLTLEERAGVRVRVVLPYRIAT